MQKRNCIQFQLTFAMAAGFIIAWTPFASLSIWETFYPPQEIPAGNHINSFYNKMPFTWSSTEGRV